MGIFLRRLSEAICVSKALDQLWKQFIDAPLQRNAKVPFIFQFHDEFLRVGVTKYRKLQYKMVRDHHWRNTAGVMGSSNPRQLEPLQINLFGEKCFLRFEIGTSKHIFPRPNPPTGCAEKCVVSNKYEPLNTYSPAPSAPTDCGKITAAQGTPNSHWPNVG